MKSLFKNLHFISGIVFLLAIVWLLIYQQNRQDIKRKIASTDNQVTPFEIKDDDDIIVRRKIKFRVLQNLKIEETEYSFKIYLGSFMVSNATTNLASACDIYPEIKIEFKAEGLVYSGEAPALAIDLNCQHEAGSDYLDALEVPKEVLLSLLNQPQHELISARLTATGLQDTLPISWYMSKIVLTGKSNHLEISSYEINFVQGKSILISP